MTQRLSFEPGHLTAVWQDGFAQRATRSPAEATLRTRKGRFTSSHENQAEERLPEILGGKP